MKHPVWNFLRQILFPENLYCIVCGIPTNGDRSDGLCDTCRSALRFPRRAECPRCGRWMETWESRLCVDCRQHPTWYDGGSASVVYDGAARTLVYALKYGGKSYLAQHMAEMMAEDMPRTREWDVVVPVSMFPKKKRRRGYCQTTLIASSLASRMEKPMVKNQLLRVVNTPPMSDLSPKERRENVKDAFRVRTEGAFQGKNVLLVDDILTTGSTANECARVLKEAGAKNVYLSVFASSLGKR